MKMLFDFTFKAPGLQFLLNNSNSAQVYFPTDCGNYELLYRRKWQMDSCWEDHSWKFYVQGNVPLAFLQEHISTQHSVSLKLNKGAFSAFGFKPGTFNPLITEVHANYFTSLKDGYKLYTLGTLDTKNVAQ